MLLTKLQNLRLHEYCTRQLGPPNWPGRLVFPPEDYILGFALFLPSQPQLAHIEISILGDTYSSLQGFYDLEDMGTRPFLSGGVEVLFMHARRSRWLPFND
ncbi:hypothetical protein B0H14DRAFT_2591594 [Mycena olivaceomarginata]|nr:hypothetical protein B0H14DRAFT_2591594 [Mycena olivaceomarginata]